jgi:cob(I)alamin adenosyltransferase
MIYHFTSPESKKFLMQNRCGLTKPRLSVFSGGINTSAGKCMKGYVQVYTGNGKGKTTAALGLALRAVGAGLRVFIGQFMKQGQYSELKSLDRYRGVITVEQYGTERWVERKPRQEDRERAEQGFRRVETIVKGGEYDLVILDEINVAVHFNLIPVDRVVGLIEQRPAHVELILTGRHAPKKIIETADLVTEMREVKHYHSEGVSSRKGIEE